MKKYIKSYYLRLASGTSRSRVKLSMVCAESLHDSLLLPANKGARSSPVDRQLYAPSGASWVPLPSMLSLASQASPMPSLHWSIGLLTRFAGACFRWIRSPSLCQDYLMNMTLWQQRWLSELSSWVQKHLWYPVMIIGKAQRLWEQNKNQQRIGICFTGGPTYMQTPHTAYVCGISRSVHNYS